MGYQLQINSSNSSGYPLQAPTTVGGFPLLSSSHWSLGTFVNKKSKSKQHLLSLKNFTTITVLIIASLISLPQKIQAQDTTVLYNNRKVLLNEVIVRNNFDYKKLLQQIKDDTTFYKAFKNLRILNYSSFNNIKMMDKKGGIKASLNSKTKQQRANGCRTMQVLEEQVTGDFYTPEKEYNYLTAQLYASLFFTKNKVCGENNVVASKNNSVTDKTGINKHKEQLKMLFFNPGKKIPGIPFIGNKLDLYDDAAKKIYNYKLNIEEYKGNICYVFSIEPKEDLSDFKTNKTVVDGMTTWFDVKTLQVMGRNYTLSYSAGVYDFEVSMEVEMGKFNDLIVPTVLRYKGNWNIIFKNRERGIFTATLFNFSAE